MATTTHQPADSGALDHLTFRYTTNPDGWVTAQIVEFPAAISQGATEHDAYVNVLEALHDLTHEPTAAERVAFAIQAMADEVRLDVEAALRGLRGRLGPILRDLLQGVTRERIR